VKRRNWIGDINIKGSWQAQGYRIRMNLPVTKRTPTTYRLRENDILANMSEQVFTLTIPSTFEKDTNTLESGPETDRFGRVLFRADYVKPIPVDSELIRTSLERTVAILRKAVIQSGIVVSKVTLKLALDAEVGLAFIGKTGLEASVEVELDFSRASEKS
jgi:hypothetical protein